MLTPDVAPALLIRALRWVSIVGGCVFTADAAVDGSPRSVAAIGIAVFVAVWWTLRDDVVDRTQDLAATLVLVVATLLGEPILAFLPAVLVSLAIVYFAPTVLVDDEPSVDAVRHVARAMGEPVMAAEPEIVDDGELRLVEEERRRAARTVDRVAEWLVFAKTGLDRHLSRRTDPRLAELRDDLDAAIGETVERSRQLRARITPKAPLSVHVARMGEWWQQFYGAEVTVRITDPDDRLSARTEQALLTVLTEALDNAGRHADADHLTVEWRVADGRGELRVVDDGVGFDPERDAAGGIRAMQREAGRVEAVLRIRSSVGKGTTVVVLAADTP